MIEAGRFEPAVLPVVVGERPRVDLLDVHPTGGPDHARLFVGPVEQQLRAGVRERGVEVSLDHVDEHHPTGRTVVDAAPGADLALRVADHDVLTHPQPLLGHLDQHVAHRRAGPASATALVGAQQMGQAGEDEPVAGVGRLDLPAVEEVLGVREDAVGI